MNVCNMILADIANGIGIRLSIFVSGCKNHCPGCFQPETWDFEYGVPYSKELEEKIIHELSKPHYHGITILGGEPMEKENQAGVKTLIRRVKERLPEKTVWIYTGYTYDKDLIVGGSRYTADTDWILDHTDVLVDGRFVESEKDISLQFRGSRNQRIIDMKKTRKNKRTILCEEYQ